VVDSGAKLTINVPVAAGDEVMGLCSVTYHRPLAWSDELTDFVMDVGRIVGVFVRRVKTTKKAVSLQLLDERKRLSAEIHDTTAQVAGALSLAAASARVCCDEGKFEALRSEILKVECMARDLVGMLRDEMTSLCAPLEQTEGLVEGVRRSLDSFERNWGISTDLRTRVEPGHFAVSMEVSLQAIRILNECLSNVLRHSGAYGVCVELTMTRKGFSLIVEDDGDGFDPDAVAEDRFGIRIMRERAALAGGSLSIISGPEGTSVCLDVMRR